MRNPLRTVDGGLGRVPAATVDTTAEVPGPPVLSRKDAERLMQAELLMAVRSLNDASTRVADQLAGRQGAINGVLGVRLHLFANGAPFMWDHPVVVGSILVTNHSAAAAVTVASGDSGGDTVPGPGVGRAKVEKGQMVPIAVGTRALTIWGADGDFLTVQAFTGMQAFGIAV